MSKRKFKVDCEMEERWVPHFLAVLKYMQQLGSMGSSRVISIYSDGDGDFHPTFGWDKDLPPVASPAKDKNGDRYYDAG